MVKKIRIQKIVIESTVEDEPIWIHVSGQEVHYSDSGEKLSVIPNNHYAHFLLEDVAEKLFTFFDPVTQTEESHSGAGISQAVIQAALIALQKKYGGEIEDRFLCL